MIKTASIDILSYLVDYSPSMVREYAFQQSNMQDDVSPLSLQTPLSFFLSLFFFFLADFADCVASATLSLFLGASVCSECYSPRVCAWLLDSNGYWNVF